jgi:hypothetical protein
MTDFNVFVSVGATATDEQEAFVRAVETRLQAEGLNPRTVGRNTFSYEAPLKTAVGLMDKCCGTVVIALERMYFQGGIEKRGGPRETQLKEVKLPTSWNQIEAAMAQSRGHPLLVIAEIGLKSEGLLEAGFDWYVLRVKPESASLNTAEFNGALAAWKEKIMQSPPRQPPPGPGKVSVTDLTIGDLLKSMKPGQLWGLLGAIALLIAGAFTVGTKLAGLH